MELTASHFAVAIVLAVTLVCLAVTLSPSDTTVASIRQVVLKSRISDSLDARGFATKQQLADLDAGIASGTAGELNSSADRKPAKPPQVPPAPGGGQRVEVRAYIEMMCPDCARFLVNDLSTDKFPSELWDFVSLELVPWVRSSNLEDA